MVVTAISVAFGHARGGGNTAREERPPGSAGVSPAQGLARSWLPALRKRERCNFSLSALSTRFPPRPAWKTELKLSGGETADDPRCARLRGRRALRRSGTWSLLAERARVAEVVQDALLHFDGERYRLLAWVIMPNHVHADRDTARLSLGRGNPLLEVVQPSVRIDCKDWSLLDARLFRPLCSR